MLNSSSGDDDGHNEHLYQALGYIMFIVLLILYIIIGSYMEVNKFSFGHETGVIILLGAMCSGVVYIFLITHNDTIH